MVETLGAEGSWFAYLVRSAAVTSWLLPRKDSKKVARLISAVSASWEDDSVDLAASCDSGPASCPANAYSGPVSGLVRQGSLCNTQSFVFSSGGLTVKQGLYEVAPEIFRVAPFVHCAPDNSAVIAFVGHLLNLQELSYRYRSPVSTPKRTSGADSNNLPPCSPSAFAAMAMAGGSMARQGSIERSLDVGALTAKVVLSMYQHDNELLLLSELQGQYAFIILDNVRKQVFAARDPSGSETLFYRIGDDGSAAFASSRAAIPDTMPDVGGSGDDSTGEWLELPPGHYVCGRTPKLHQFALTPEQLQVREMCEDLDPQVVPMRRRSSLDNNSSRQPRSLEGDLFGFGMDM